MVPHRLMIFMAAMTVSAVTARAQDVKPRSIEPGRIIAAGEYAVAIKPRSIEPGPIIAVGEYAVAIRPRSIEPGRIIAAGEFPAFSLKPRTIALNGIVAQGSYSPISPRTIRITGWTASPPPKGGRK